MFVFLLSEILALEFDHYLYRHTDLCILDKMHKFLQISSQSAERLWSPKVVLLGFRFLLRIQNTKIL